MNVLLVGGESAGLQALRAITRTDHRLVAVLASESKRRFAGASVTGVAEKLGVPVWSAVLVKDPGFAETVTRSGVDIILNVHALFIFCRDVLSAPRIGCFNLHPGPLPEYAGLNAPSWAILRGESTHGVTLHWMSRGIDTGAIAYRQDFAIDEQESGLSLALKCVERGIPLIEELLRDAATDPERIPRTPQDVCRRQYFGPEVPHEGRVSWNQPAHAIARFVKAADYRPLRSPWGHPRMKAGARDFGVASISRTSRATDCSPGTIGAVTERGVEVACLDEWILLEVLEETGRYTPAAEALRGVARIEP